MTTFSNKTVSYTETRSPPYSWHVGYNLSFIDSIFQITERIRLTGADAKDQLSTWESTIEADWNQKVFFADSTRLYEVKLDVQFVSTGENNVVEVHSGNGRSDAANWYIEPLSPHSYSHEVGHLLGNFDEYSGGATLDGYTTTGTLMSTTEVTGVTGFDRYFSPVETKADGFAGTSFSVVLAKVGTTGGDTLNGTSGMDGFYGLGGNDVISGRGGNDYLDGGDGRDTAVYLSNNPADYDIRQNADGTWSVRHARGAKDEGTDTLKNVETVQFAGGKQYDLKKEGLSFETDFAFVIDTTGSMGSSIGAVKSQATTLINALFADGKTDARIGVVGFKDTTNGEPSSVILSFTDQDDLAARKSAALAAINSITVGGGGDTPETPFDGLLKALNGTMGAWRPGAGTHRIVLFTDAPAKDGALAGQVAALAADPVQVFTIFTGPAGTDHSVINSIAATTGGAPLTAATNDELVKDLLAIITIPPANHLPVTGAVGFAATHNQNVAATMLFSATDADGDAPTKYQFYDSTADPASGHFVVDGVAQAASRYIDVTAAQLALTSFQSGSGSDDLWVRAFDGFDWSAWKEFHVTAPIDHAPVITASDKAATHGQGLGASALFSASDADSDAIGKYQFYDSTADPASGHWVVNGVAQGANQYIDVAAAQLGLTSFQSGSGSDDLWVRANDGTMWGAWKEFHVTAPIDHMPVVTASDKTATHGQSLAASALFSASDADSDPISKYQFYDSTADPASGHWVVSGVAQGAGLYIDVTAAQLGQASFQSGSGSDDLWARAFDGIAWGPWKEFHVNAPIDRAPVASAADRNVAHGASTAASSLFSVSDADGDAISKYQFYDSTADPASGHWVVNGVAQSASQTIDVAAAQLAQTSFQSGSGGDDLWVRASDGMTWSAWKEFHVTAPMDHAPVAAASDKTATHGQSFAASALFSVSDADGDSLSKYQFYDSTADPASGHWVVNGVAQSASQTIDVAAAQLAQTSFQSGSGSDDLWVRANDGMTWSAWKEFHVNAPADHVPVITAPDRAATHGQSFAASTLFSVSDVDGDAISKYQFWDSTIDPASGHWVVNGAAQNAGQAIDVTAAQLAQTSFQSGSGSDDLWVRANDGMTWSAWKEFHVNAPADHAPVVNGGDASLALGTSVAASSLFINVSDADSDAISMYQFWDGTADASSGHFERNGAAQGAQQIIDVLAAQLDQERFMAGAASGVDHLYVRAFDGELWSNWHALNATSHT